MKHVFVIHSNTVLLSSLGVVEKEMIAPKDTVFYMVEVFILL